MAINLSSLLNQINQNQVNSSEIENINKLISGDKNVSSDNSGLSLLKNMLAGQTFSGKIIGINGEQASIMLNDGSKINARISENTELTPGQNMTFLVEENTSSSISIKPLESAGQESFLINKALDAAGLFPSEENVNIVSNLLRMNMPVDAKTIGNMVKYSLNYPETSLNTIANLIRLDIPVTEDNIMQFEAYRNYENSIAGKLSLVSTQLSDIINGILENPSSIHNTDSLNVLSEINSFVNSLYNNNGIGDNELIQSAGFSEIFSDTEFSQIKDILSEFVKENPSVDIHELTDKTNNNTATVKDIFNGLTNILKYDVSSNLSFKDIPVQKMMEQIINETMRITPENVAKENGIKNYYKRIKHILDNKDNDLSNDALSSINKNLNQIKSNIDFMNDLNKNMTYFQMPVRFKESNGNGELYVFTNKKAMSGQSDNVSALLHLDMDNLGPIDVYVRLQGKNVNTNFCLETEELLDFVYSNIDKLNARLEKLGYSTKFEMTLSTNDNKFDFVNDFIEKDIHKNSTSSYILDVKA